MAVFDSSTVITPSAETLSIDSAISLPIYSSPDEIVATRAISDEPFTFLEFAFIASIAASTAFFMPLRSTIGFAPEVTFFIPSLISAWAKTVAVVVPSPAISLVLVATSFTSWAPIFSNGSSSSISFAIVTPSLVISGAPKLRSSTTFLPLGPNVTFTVLASLSTPACNALRASSP